MTNPDVQVWMKFKVKNDKTLDFDKESSSSSDVNKATIDDDGNVDVLAGNTAWLQFVLESEGCENTWYFTKLDIKDKDIGQWEGAGSKNALNSAEEGDYSVIDVAEPIDEKTGVVSIPYAHHQVGFTLQDLNANASTVDYRVYVSNERGKSLKLDPRVRDSGGIQ